MSGEDNAQDVASGAPAPEATPPLGVSAKNRLVYSQLCWDDDGQGDSPYPLSALGWLESRTYPEVQRILRRLRQGVALPQPSAADRAGDTGSVRADLAQALGVPPVRAPAFGAGCARGLDALARALRREGLPVPATSRQELLATAARIFSGQNDWNAHTAVRLAAKLIHAVDQHLTQEHLQ